MSRASNEFESISKSSLSRTSMSDKPSKKKGRSRQLNDKDNEEMKLKSSVFL